jgi:hypothetical protein
VIFHGIDPIDNRISFSTTPLPLPNSIARASLGKGKEGGGDDRAIGGTNKKILVAAFMPG